VVDRQVIQRLAFTIHKLYGIIKESARLWFIVGGMVSAASYGCLTFALSRRLCASGLFLSTVCFRRMGKTDGDHQPYGYISSPSKYE